MHDSAVKHESIRLLFSNLRADVIFLQETHSTEKRVGNSILFSHVRTNARGVAILIRNGLDISIQRSEIGSDGRFIVIKAMINNELYTIVNLYGRNKHRE